MSSIKDVARLAGTSISTVSRYFHEPQKVKNKTRQSIKAAIEQLEYSPNTLARNFRMGSTRVILVLTSAALHPFYMEIVSGIFSAAQRSQYTVRIQQTEEAQASSREMVSLITSRQADGIIVLGHAGRFPTTVSRSSPEHNLPIVVCGEVTDPQLLKYPRFQIDGHAAAMELTEYLIRCGHKKIAFMRGEIPLLKMNAREAGYRTAMQAAGLEVDPAWLVDGYLTVEGGQRAVADLLALKDRPSALICANDEMALGAMGELTHRGLSAPEDLSIAGFDNTRYSRIWNPALTTIAQPAEEMGERAMHCLLRMIEGHEITTEVEYFAHQLIIRKSVKNLDRRIR